MFKNYLKTAWRNIWKQKIFSIINILGLSAGIAFTLLMAAYVWGEVQVNHHLKNVDNQYIIQSKWKDPNMGIEVASIAELPEALKEQYPGLVENYYRFDGLSTNVSKGEKHFRESVQLGDSTLLKMYGFRLIQGNPNTALNAPFSVIITRRVAIKYFGKYDVVGKQLNFESFSGGKHNFTITGVLDNIPENSVTHLNAANMPDFFLNEYAAKYFKRSLTGWDNPYIVCYIELKRGANPNDVENAMLALLKKNAPEQISKNLTPYLVALKDYNMIAEDGIVKKMTTTLSYIALFIMLMAILNYVNICIGRGSGRMKEIGIRKVLGGLRKQLGWQFLAESILLVIIATILALVIYLFARPYFSAALGKDITSLFAFPVYFAAFPFLFSLIVGLLAGIYPAFVLSGLKSIDSLKGKLTSVKGDVFFRNALIVFQFATASIVLIGAFIISQQISLFFSNNLGYNKDDVIYAQLPRDWSAKGVNKMESARYQLAQIPQVKSVALSFEIPNGANGGNYPIYRQGANPAQTIATQGLIADNQYALTYHIPLKAGEFFKPVFRAADTLLVVINETESKALGFKNADEAIGQKIMSPGSPVASTICGVTADFHFGSMQQKIQPITFTNVNYASAYRYFSIKLKPGDIRQNIAAVKQKWAELIPDAPFEYYFMDEALNKLYATELQLKKAAYIATILAMVIVLLGVLGLVSLNIQKRTKEIGIRKVLGSSSIGICLLFLNDFLGLVLIAAIIACPVAYLIMQKWLSNYAYRIDISLSPFLFSIIVLTVSTTFLIVLQTIKAARTNPVKNLRDQ